MSLISEKDKEKFIQTGNTFYNCLQKLNCSINTFIQLLTSYLGNQMPYICVNESGTVKDYFEEVVCSLKKVQGDIETKDKTRAECCQFANLETTMNSVMEKDPCCPNTAKKLCATAKEISDCAQLPLILMLKNVNFFESMECALSQLMKSSIMNLRLIDLHKNPSELTIPFHPAKGCCPVVCPPKQPTDILEKLSNLGGQSSMTPSLTATDYLLEIVKTMEPVADKLQQVSKAIETNMELLKLSK
ncbi:uncharacterized protein C12orf60 homolog isoform X2 [Macrotis lagotis]